MRRLLPFAVMATALLLSMTAGRAGEPPAVWRELLILTGATPEPCEGADCGSPAGPAHLFHLAENQVPVALVGVTRRPDYTEVRLETQVERKKVCWSAQGPNSPYLLAGGKRYRYLGGDHVSNCPDGIDYNAHELMILRFEPLDGTVSEFSLVEGQGGENQMIDPASSPGTRYWNFIHVKLK